MTLTFFALSPLDVPFNDANRTGTITISANLWICGIVVSRGPVIVGGQLSEHASPNSCGSKNSIIIETCR